MQVVVASVVCRFIVCIVFISVVVSLGVVFIIVTIFYFGNLFVVAVDVHMLYSAFRVLR